MPSEKFYASDRGLRYLTINPESVTFRNNDLRIFVFDSKEKRDMFAQKSNAQADSFWGKLDIDTQVGCRMSGRKPDGTYLPEYVSQVSSEIAQEWITIIVTGVEPGDDDDFVDDWPEILEKYEKSFPTYVNPTITPKEGLYDFTEPLDF